MSLRIEWDGPGLKNGETGSRRYHKHGGVGGDMRHILRRRC